MISDAGWVTGYHVDRIYD